MLHTLFDNTQQFLLIGFFFSVAISALLHVRDKENLAIGFLLLSAILIFTFSALLDPFLNLWDERFHALVAKNMMDHPLMPTLYDDPVVNMEYDRWDRYHIWLHKQPLFLWQIVLSFKIFGISEFSLRLPNIVLGVALIYATYRSGKLLSGRNVGFVASMLVLSSIYLIQVAGGRQELEHNDFTFLVYISLSLWSLIEYSNSGKKVWIYLIGIFSGFAILCKWLVGLLVYFGWFVLKALQKHFKIRQYNDLLVALVITLVIAIPWQILTFIWYPAEAAGAFRFNGLHLMVPLDGHRGTIWYHFDMFNVIYGAVASFFILPGFFLFLKRSGNNRKIHIAFLSMIGVVYLFFTIAATKMPSFTTVVLMPVYIALAVVLNESITCLNELITLKFRKYVFAIFVLAFMLFRFDLDYLEEKHAPNHVKNEYSRMLIHNKNVFQSLELPENAVLFNVKGRHYVDAMFYTDFPAYNFIPGEEQYTDLLQKGRVAAIFVGDGMELPEYITRSSGFIEIPLILQGYQ